jgi:thiamine phosphate synthase YjbQ (UPF0047 family)
LIINYLEVPSLRVFINITSQVEQCLEESGIQEGLVLCKAYLIRINVKMREADHKQADWSTEEVFKLVPLQERDVKIMEQPANMPGLYEHHPDYDVPVPNPDGDKLTIEDFLTPNAEFKTRV